MERLGKPRQGRQGRRLSQREVSESNPVAQGTGNSKGCLDYARHEGHFVIRVIRVIRGFLFLAMVAPEKLQTRCVIAGGGPAGIMAGYLLARAGVPVIVLEKHADF